MNIAAIMKNSTTKNCAYLSLPLRLLCVRFERITGSKFIYTHIFSRDVVTISARPMFVSRHVKSVNFLFLSADAVSLAPYDLLVLLIPKHVTSIL